MNLETRVFGGIRPVILFLGFTLVSLLLGGCWKESIVWSPDGSRAAIITSEGLHLCDAQGKLSPLLVPKAYRAAWLGDSKHLVLAVERPLKDFAEVAAALGPERTRQLVAKAEYIWAPLEAGSVSLKDFEVTPIDDAWAVLIYLRDKHSEAFHKIMAKESKDEPEPMTVPWHSLVMAKMNGDTLELGSVLYEGLAQLQGLRPAPAGAAVAFTTHLAPSPDSDNGLQLLVAPTDGSSPAAVVATHTAAHSDWTPDGQTLVFLKSSHTPNGDDPRVGEVAERTVLASDGHIQLAEKTHEFAALVFKEGSRVRCLKDGRVLFNTTDIHFPTTEVSQSREQFFSFNRTLDVVELTPLIPGEKLKTFSRSLESFEVGPDGTQVLVGGDNGDIWLLNLSSGAVEHIETHLGSGSHFPLPAWQGAGQFSYPRNKSFNRTTSLELILRQAGGEISLSREWPQEFLYKLSGEERPE